MEGWIKLHKQFLDWEWFTDINTCHLFLYCLVKANFKDTKWKGIVIKRGSFVTSYQSLSEATGLSIRNVRTSLKKLTNKTTSELTHKTTNHYSIITVKNYDKYQLSDKQNDKQTDKQVTTNKEIKNSNISYINSLSLNKDEREILKNYLLRQKRTPDNLDAYMQTLIKNGDWVQIVEKERKRQKRKEEKTIVVEEVSAEEKQEGIKRAREFLKQRGIL